MLSGNLTEQQQKETWVVLLQLGAIAVLAYSFIANVQAGMVMAVAWRRTSQTTGMSPLAHCESWAQFLQKSIDNQHDLWWSVSTGESHHYSEMVLSISTIGSRCASSFAIAKQIFTLESDCVYTLHVDCRQSCLFGGVDGRNGVVDFTMDRRACLSGFNPVTRHHTLI